MHKHLVPTILSSHLQTSVARGKIRKSPEVYTDIEQRLSKRAKRDWEGATKNFTEIECKIKAEYLPSTGYADNPLFAIVVKPLQKLPTTKPPGSETPYHISIAFHEPHVAKLLKAIHSEYAKWKTVFLKGYVQGSTFVLDEKSPIASDPKIKEAHSKSYYAKRPLHMSL